MLTLERLVESIKMQIKPHITDDQILSEEWLIEMINHSRSALLRKIYVSGESLTPFYQVFKSLSEESSSIQVSEDTIIPFKFAMEIINCPTILGSSGKKNIQYVGSEDYSMVDIHYVEFEEFISYQLHRFGDSMPCYTLFSDRILVRNSRQQKKWLVRAIFSRPQDLPEFDYSTSRYPIDEANARQLEIITFQHIAPKLGLPVDLLNNGQDETKNAPVRQQPQQQEE